MSGQPLTVGSLFSGYDGLGMAVDALFPQAERAWFCEYDDAPAKILAHHWPTVPNFRDVTEVDWEAMPPVDLATAGYPCQPFSGAGQRKGTNDERHLWPYVRDAIRHLRPRYTLLENVAGHRSLGFDRVLGDLAEDGMHVRWTSLRASDVGAPHHRDRLFILVSTPDADRGERDWDERTQGWGTLGREAVAGRRAGLPADDHGVGRGQGAGQPGAGESEESTDLGGVAVLPDARGYRLEGHQESDCEPEEPELEASLRVDASGCSVGIEWGSYAPAVRRWERLTRPAPAPTELNGNGRPRLSAAFAEWMMGLPAGHVTDPAIGISRAHQLKAIGNGVCPPQAISAYASLVAA